MHRGAFNIFVTDPKGSLRESVVLGCDAVNCTFQANFCSCMKLFGQMAECLQRCSIF